MPVPPAQLSVLVSLEEPKRLTQIAEENALQQGTARKAVKTLEEQGVVETHKEAGHLVVACTSKALPPLARALIFDQPRSDWDRVLHGDRPTVLHVLDRVNHPALTAEVCDKTRRAIYHAIETHAPRGLLVETENGYRINPRLSALREFLSELTRTTAHHRTSRIDRDAGLIWHLGPELLLRSPNDLEGETIRPGALSRFGLYDVPLMTGQRSYYYVSTRELDAADAILQALLVDPESRIHRSYAALVYEKTRPDNLDHKARIYGLRDEAEQLAEYVERREQVGRFLPWEEHDRYRRQYGVGT